MGAGAVTHLVASLVSYSKQLLCDVMIVAEDVEIEAHRVVLAACSPYFCAMFTGMLRGNNNSVLGLQPFWEDIEGGVMGGGRKEKEVVGPTVGSFYVPDTVLCTMEDLMEP